MKKICILYFSGTGMTRRIVKNLEAIFQNLHAEVACRKMEDTKGVRWPFSFVKIKNWYYIDKE